MVAGPVMPVVAGIRKGTKVSIPLVTFIFCFLNFYLTLDSSTITYNLQ